MRIVFSKTGTVNLEMSKSTHSGHINNVVVVVIVVVVIVNVTMTQNVILVFS